MPPETSDREIFADLPGKKRQGKGGNGEEKNENCEREGGKLKIEGGKKEKDRNLFIYFFIFYFLFYFILFFFTFQNDENLFWATKIEIFYREKAFHTGKCFFPM